MGSRKSEIRTLEIAGSGLLVSALQAIRNNYIAFQGLKNAGTDALEIFRVPSNNGRSYASAVPAINGSMAGKGLPVRVARASHSSSGARRLPGARISIPF